MKLNENLIKIRALRADDKNFILNSWLKSFRNSDMARNCPSGVYFGAQQHCIEWCLEHHRVRIICVAKDEFHVVGYIVFGELGPGHINIDYVYIKSPYRRFGLASRLIEEMRKEYPEDSSYSCDAPTVMAIKLQDKFNFKINPYTYLEGKYHAS